jgi:c-di-GMP-binding flagellar brake protein YcgR
MLRRLMPGRGVRVSRGISLDMSAGGMGALVEAGLKVGDIVEIDLNLPHLKLSTVAIVRHSSSVQSGFEFLGLTPEERQSLANVVSDVGNA